MGGSLKHFDFLLMRKGVLSAEKIWLGTWINLRRLQHPTQYEQIMVQIDTFGCQRRYCGDPQLALHPKMLAD
jgi:hypothetical protein